MVVAGGVPYARLVRPTLGIAERDAWVLASLLDAAMDAGWDGGIGGDREGPSHSEGGLLPDVYFALQCEDGWFTHNMSYPALPLVSCARARCTTRELRVGHADVPGEALCQRGYPPLWPQWDFWGRMGLSFPPFDEFMRRQAQRQRSGLVKPAAERHPTLFWRGKARPAGAPVDVRLAAARCGESGRFGTTLDLAPWAPDKAAKETKWTAASATEGPGASDESQANDSPKKRRGATRAPAGDAAWELMWGPWSEHKYLLYLRGYGASSGHKYILAQNATVLMLAEDPSETWYSELLVPMTHYLPVPVPGSAETELCEQLDEAVRLLEANPSVAEELRANLQEWLWTNLRRRSILSAIRETLAAMASRDAALRQREGASPYVAPSPEAIAAAGFERVDCAFLLRWPKVAQYIAVNREWWRAGWPQLSRCVDAWKQTG